MDNLPPLKPLKINESHVKTKWLDVPYAPLSGAQKMDIYLPVAGKGPFPVVMFVHGGAFLLGDKALNELEDATDVLDKGYAFVSINYRLSTKAHFPAQINDVKGAIRFLRANASKYDIDASRIASWGASAGGMLCALVGTTGDMAEFKDPAMGNLDQSDKVQVVVDWYAPINCLAIDRQFEEAGIKADKHSAPDSPESLLMGKQITLIPDLVAKTNAENYISAGCPPFLIQHGKTDNRVPVAQSIEFAEKLRAIIGKEKVELDLFEGAGHLDPVFPGAANLKRVLDFIEKYLK
jgi:acetyl esterase/lipase